MVTVEVHTVGDVIAAYLEILGFQNGGLEKAVRYLKGEVDFSAVSGDEILALLDNRIGAAAAVIFPEEPLNAVIGTVKEIFLTNEGATAWGIEVLKGKDVSEDFIEWTRQRRIPAVPEAIRTKMEKQKIALLHPAHMFKKLLRKKKGISVYVSK